MCEQSGAGEAAYLVELLIKLAELGHFLHDLLPHEEGRVEHGVALVVQDPHGVVDQRLLQEHQRSLNAARGGRFEERKGDRRSQSAASTAAAVVPESVVSPSPHLQEVAPAAGHHGSLVALEAVDHDHQVHVGVLLLDGAVAPGALHLVVRILRRGGGGRETGRVSYKLYF